MHNSDRFVDCLKESLPDIDILRDEPMSAHTSFRIGGPADVYIEPDRESLRRILPVCVDQGIPVTLIGNGTNILVGDLGIRGVCLCIGRKMSGIEVNGEHIRSGAGELMVSVSNTALHAGLTGLEYASGIPGSIGGAVFMNAGAYGGEIKDSIIGVECVLPDGGIMEYRQEDLKQGYRTSIFAEDKDFSKGIITSVLLGLRPGDRDAIKSRMDKLSNTRREKQPLDKPSAGSTFKRPEGNFAGKLIMDAGLKGYTVGGAQVSEKHAGFVINNGNATARDVRQLMEDVISKVHRDFGVVLEPEVKFVGEF